MPHGPHGPHGPCMLSGQKNASNDVGSNTFLATPFLTRDSTNPDEHRRRYYTYVRR